MSINKDQIQIELDKNNGNTKLTAKCLEISYSVLMYNIYKYNLIYKNKKQPVKIKAEELEELYLKYNSFKKVAKILNCSGTNVGDMMKKFGLYINKPIRYTCNENFFSNNTEESFYWAGFIAADGCVRIKNKSNILSIALAEKDKHHLLLFKNQICAENPIHEYIIKARKENWNDSKKVEIAISSFQIVNDLQKFNIVPRKTKIYTFPNWLIDHPLTNHFMRGYLDGDGSWYIDKCGQKHFSLRGTSDFLKIYRDILEKECNLPKREKPIRINCGIGILEYGGNGVTAKIRNFLYKNSSVFLERKFNIVK